MSDYQSISSAPAQPRRNWYLTVLIVGSTLFAVGGVARALFYGPVHARWLIAHAANELIAQRVESAETWLDKAYATSKDIASDRDYWRLRFEILSGKKPIPPGELDAFVDEAIESIVRDADPAYRSEVASQLSRLLFNDMHFKQALKILDEVFPPMGERTSSENNEVAYTRVIAQGDLDLALKEINLALEDRRVAQFSQLFDTKAWILYKKGDTEKALTFAQAAVREWYREIAAVNPSYALLLLPDDRFSLAPKKYGQLSPTAPVDEDSPLDRTKPGMQSDAADKSQFSEFAKALAVIQEALEDREAQSVDQPKETVRQSATKSEGNKSNEAEKDQFESTERILDVINSSNIGRDRGSHLHTTAVLRYHRACILDELNRLEEAQKDYYWLDEFGYTQIGDLY